MRVFPLETGSRAVGPAPATPYFREGSGSPLVLLHGATMSWRAWEPVLPFLVGRHDVFAPTMAGHRGGPTVAEGADPGVSAIADVLCEQLDRAGIESAHLVGNSLGGWVAFELARRGRARSLVAISPAGTWKARRDLMKLLMLFRLGYMAVGSPRLSALARNGMVRRAALGRCFAHPENLSAQDLETVMADLEECAMLPALFSGEARLHQMTEFDVALCPVKVAWAEQDRVIPFNRFGRPMQQVVRGAEFVMLPKVGHVPMWDDPRLVARTVLEMTSSVDAAYAASAAPAAAPPARRTRRTRANVARPAGQRRTRRSA
jgi:pimeloyl-ACP methyl ester carboxylesterase